MEAISEPQASQSDSIIISALVVVISIWSIQYHWHRRRLYQLSWKLPGPLTLPFVGGSYMFLRHPFDVAQNLIDLMAWYPGICKIWHLGKLYYCVSKPKYYHIILNSPNALGKDELYRHLEAIIGLGMITAPVHTWKNIRRQLSPSFKQRVLNTFVEIFSEQCDVLIEIMKPQAGKGEVNMAEMTMKCTLDIIGEAALGVKIDSQTTNNQFGIQLEKVLEIIVRRMMHTLYNYDFIFNLSPYRKALTKFLEPCDKFIKEVIIKKQIQNQEENEGLAEIEENPNRVILDSVMKVAEEDKFSNQAIRDEVMTVMAAGSETTAAAMCFLMTMLALHPEIQDKVLEEALDVLGPDRKVLPEDIERFEYLDRVIKETLRIFPVVAFIVRSVTEDIDLQDGTIIPANSSVVLSFLYTLRSEEYWTDPMKFDPDRFLPEEVDKRHPCTHIPFSYGRRNCIANKFAVMLMKTVIPTVVRNFRLETGYKRVEDIQMTSRISSNATYGYKLSFQNRCL